jgi:hypothetical protein
VSRAGLRVELDGPTVHARWCWLGLAVPRTPAGPMPAEEVEKADRVARVLLNAAPGDLIRAGNASSGFTYRRPDTLSQVRV